MSPSGFDSSLWDILQRLYQHHLDQTTLSWFSNTLQVGLACWLGVSLIILKSAIESRYSISMILIDRHRRCVFRGIRSWFSLVVERQFCKLKIGGSVPPSGQVWVALCDCSSRFFKHSMSMISIDRQLVVFKGISSWFSVAVERQSCKLKDGCSISTAGLN